MYTDKQTIKDKIGFWLFGLLIAAGVFVVSIGLVFDIWIINI